jgi:hypothetical protein
MGRSLSAGTDTPARTRNSRLEPMSALVCWVLIANAVWNAIVWPPFLRRIRKDPRARDAQGRATTFLRVHTVLIGVSLALAVVSLVVAIVALVQGA